RNSRIGGVDKADGSRGINFRLLSRNEGRNLVILFGPISHQVPAESVIQCKVGPDLPTVLPEASHILMSRIECLRIGLVVEIWRSDQKIHEVRTGLAAIECKTPVKFGVRTDVN